jgi:hypothetical protein
LHPVKKAANKKNKISSKRTSQYPTLNVKTKARKFPCFCFFKDALSISTQDFALGWRWHQSAPGEWGTHDI